MKSLVIKGILRENLGKKDAKKLRREDNVPCVIYGDNEPIHFYAEFNEFRKIIYTPSVFLIDIELDGKVIPVIMQDIQWHPVHEQVLHIDFLQIKEDKPIKISVPVVTTGLAVGITAGGKLKNNLRKLKVKALAKDLPDTIEIDITKLKIGQNIKVEDMSIENLEFLDSPSNVIVSVNITRLAKSAAAGEEEGEEGEEDEGGENEESAATEE